MTGAGLRDLVLVAGHAAFRAHVTACPEDLESDEAWALFPFQSGEPRFFLEHARRGAQLAAREPAALLVFSGGRTRREAGEWSEARTYRAIAAARGFWVPAGEEALRDDVAGRTAVEDFARDSLENLLFSLCRFRQVVGSWPRRVHVVSWGFKRERFDLHRRALRLAAERFRFEGVGEPLDLGAARAGERAALERFREDPLGTTGALAEKRAARDPFGRGHPYRACPGTEELFGLLDGEGSAGALPPAAFPW